MKKLHHRQWLSTNVVLVGSALLLSGLSLVVLFAIELNNLSERATLFNPWQQVFAVALGVVAMVAAARVDLGLLRRYAVHVYGFGLLLLIALPLIAEPIQGATRWFTLGPVQLQPAELMKISLIILLARLLSKRSQATSSNILVASALYVGPPVVLVLTQPDLGTAAILTAVWFGVLTTTKLPRVVLISLVALAAVTMVVATPLLADYQQARLNAFLNPTEDLAGSGYNAQQAMIAIGSGQLTGRGLDAGSQSQLHFLPSAHTDFMFSVIGEKLGFLGAGLVMVGLASLSLMILAVARRARSLFGAYIVVGVGLLIGLQGAINIGMNLGLLPVTGIPLPFISYGGTHTVVAFLALGLVLNVSRSGRQLDFTS